MAVNPASPFFITANIDRYRAVVPVDIQSQDPNAPDVVSGKAQVVIIGGTLNGSNQIVPLTGGGGGGGSSLADSLVVDAAGVYWILQDQGGGTFVYYKLSTLVVGTPTAPVVPAATSTGLQIVDQTYTCTAAGTGYAIGDIVEHIIVLNITTNPPTISQSSWINITQGTVLAGAPTAANINAIDDNVMATIADGADVAQGAKADAAYAGAGTASVIAALKGCYNLLAAALPAGANVIGSVNINGTLPAFAATPTFNLGTLNGAATNATLLTISAQLPTALGQQLSSASMGVVLASDQAALAVNADAPQILANPAANSIAALNGTITWNVEGGGGYILSLTNGPGATTAWVGTVTFQYTINGGTTWNNLNATPLTSATGATVTTATANGLWQVNPPNGANVQVRANMTAYTSGTVYADLASNGQVGGMVLLPWVYTVTSGQMLVGPINASGFTDFAIQVSAVTTTVLTVQGTNDPSLTTWDTVPAVLTDASTDTPAGTISAVGTYRWSAAGFKYFRVQCTTTGTVLTVQGVVGRLGVPSSAMMTIQNANTPMNITQAAGVALSATTAQFGMNIVNLGGTAVAGSIANGSTNKALGVTQSTAVSQVDQNATAFAGAGSVLGTVVASTQGGGAVISSEINVSALTLGTATAVYAILQESRGGTNFSDIWVSPPITATGIISTPPLVVAGRRRWRFFSIGGTSTTVTVTITTLELPAGNYPIVREGYDGYSATNPLATQFNSVATASTLVSTTLSSTSTPFYIEGSKNLVASLTVTGGTPTTNPVLTLQTSLDGTNWFNTTLTLTPTAAGTFGASITNVVGRFARFIVSTASAGGTAYTFGKLGLLATN